MPYYIWLCWENSASSKAAEEFMRKARFEFTSSLSKDTALILSLKKGMTKVVFPRMLPSYLCIFHPEDLSGDCNKLPAIAFTFLNNSFYSCHWAMQLSQQPFFLLFLFFQLAAALQPLTWKGWGSFKNMWSFYPMILWQADFLWWSSLNLFLCVHVHISKTFMYTSIPDLVLPELSRSGHLQRC